MTQDTLVNFLRTLPIKSHGTGKGYYMVYDNRVWKLGMVEIKPQPSQQELDEAVEWLEENSLALPVSQTNSEITFLVRV